MNAYILTECLLIYCSPSFFSYSTLSIRFSKLFLKCIHLVIVSIRVCNGKLFYFSENVYFPPSLYLILCSFFVFVKIYCNFKYSIFSLISLRALMIVSFSFLLFCFFHSPFPPSCLFLFVLVTMFLVDAPLSVW